MIRRAIRILIYACLLSAGLVVGGLYSVGLVTHRGGTVEVPNLYNKTLDEALDLLGESQLELRKDESRYSALIPEHHIISQDPSPGTVVRRRRPVTVVVSRGNQYSPVPGVTGKSLRAGRILLRQGGFQSGHISWIHHGAEENTIVAQTPEGGDSAVRDSTVDLLVSLGARQKVYRLPDFTQRSIDEASKLVHDLGLDLGEVQTRINPDLPQGKVLEQDPKAGARVQEGDTIRFVMSVPAELGRRAVDHFAVVTYRATPGFFKRQVRIEIIDNSGAQEVHRAMHFPAEVISVPYAYRPPATVKVYEDDTLMLERTHE